MLCVKKVVAVKEIEHKKPKKPRKYIQKVIRKKFRFKQKLRNNRRRFARR